MQNAVEHPLKAALRRRWPPMSQAKFARLLDLNTSQLSKYLSGERQPPEGFWKAAAEVLGVDEGEIRPPAEGAAA
jgi:transcriptional regulator with XRE-family HTH domain